MRDESSPIAASVSSSSHRSPPSAPCCSPILRWCRPCSPACSWTRWPASSSSTSRSFCWVRCSARSSSCPDSWRREQAAARNEGYGEGHINEPEALFTGEDRPHPPPGLRRHLRHHLHQDDGGVRGHRLLLPDRPVLRTAFPSNGAGFRATSRPHPSAARVFQPCSATRSTSRPVRGRCRSMPA